MPDYTAIISAISEMNDAHKLCLDSLKEEIRFGLRASAVQIEAEMSVVNNRIGELSKHVAEQNSNVFHLKEESENRKQAVLDFRVLEGKHKKQYAWIKKNTVWILLGFVLFVSIIVTAVEIVGVKVVVEKAIEKVSGL